MIKAEYHLMKQSKLSPLIASLSCLTLLFSCTKKTEQFVSEKISDYWPLAVGKYITYRLDSTVFANFGRSEEQHRYQVKHIVDELITDNQGRPSYRVVKFLRDSAGTREWIPNGTYFITPLNDQIEVVEDNLRFIKLHQPFRLTMTWKGNSFLSSDPYSSLYSFSNDDNMNDWNYKYEKFEQTAAIGSQTLNQVYTVSLVNESLNAPVTDTRSYGYRNFALEKYAKNIGPVYRELLMWEYQPNTNSVSGGYKIGFGIKMWMIDHN